MSVQETDAQLATRLATQAGHVLLELREQMFADGASTWDVKDAGDAAAQRFLAAEFALHRPNDAVLSEEGKEDPRRFEAERVWIVDPLDGTREYSEPGRIDWAVHIALWNDDRFEAAAVSLPAIDRTFSTENPAPMPPYTRERPRLVTSRTRAPYAAVLVAEGLDCEAVRLGSAGAKAMSVVMGETDIYVHDGGMYQWDSAAPAGVALASGFHVSRLDGTPIVYNDRDPWLPDFIVCRPELAEPVLKALWGVNDIGELTAIRWEIADRVATVWLHRPHRHNAWTGRMHAEFRMVMADLESRDDVRAVVVTGTPPAFCVGGDSKALQGHVERGGYDSGLPTELAQPGGGERLEADFVWQLGYRLPIIAAVNGACAGVGLALVLFCDLRFVAAGAKLTTAAPKLGLPAEYGSSWMLPRLVGVTRANDLLLSGRVVTGAETADWGLWNGVEADGTTTLTAAQAYAGRLAETAGPNAVAKTKRQITDDLLRHDPAASVADSLRLLDESMGTAEYREGIAALTEKRPPKF